MTEWGIFSDESVTYSCEDAVEAPFYSREEAEKRLTEMRTENGDDDDNCYVHECEEPDEDDDDETEEEEELDTEDENGLRWPRKY